MDMYQVILGLLSTSQLIHIKTRLIHVHLLLDHYFLFNRWIRYGFLGLLIGHDHVHFHPKKGHIHSEG